jgi:DNA polymerase-3 subunit gamma/tau
VGQENIGTTLKNAIQRKQLAHAYLFCGPRGVGKTTCARIFAKTINCQNLTPELEACGECESCRSFAEGRSYSIHELDAASNNSVDDIRVLTDQVRVPPQIGHYSVYIIDEAHMLSSSAFNAFLKTLEEPPAHAIFILATTEKHKILPTILSRCQIYDFNRISIPNMVKHLADIAAKEGVNVEPEALNVIAQKADGAMRDALSIYDQAVAFCGDNLTYANVIENLNVLDYEYYFKLTGHFIHHRYADALLLFDEVLAKGFDAQHFIAGLSMHFRDLLVCKDPRTLSLLEVGDTVAKRYEAQAAQAAHTFLYEALQVTNACEMGYKSSGNPRLHVELSLLRLSNIASEKKNDSTKITGKAAVVVENMPPPATHPAPSPAPSPVSSTVSTATVPVQPKTMAFSIKATKAEKLELIENEKRELEKRNNPFTQEQLIDAWTELIARVTDQSHLTTTLKASSPVLQAGNMVAFPVGNELQKDWMKSETILDFLCNKLQNDNIKLDVTVNTQTAGNAKKPYTHDEKFKFLIEQYPAVAQLKQIMNLDIR